MITSNNFFLTVCAGVFALFAFLAVPAFGLTGFETQVTTNTSDQSDSAISGNLMVYTDEQNGNQDIYLYDISAATETNLTPGTPNDQYLNDINGVRVVFTDVKATGTNIWLYDISSSFSFELTTDGNSYRPAIEGDHVVWIAVAGASRNIILADLVTWTTTKLTADPLYADSPRVDGDWVAWEERVGSYKQIKAYRISTSETRTLTSGACDHRWPDVSGDLVVWSDKCNGSWDIYSYDLTTSEERRITDDPNDEQFPRIDGMRVVWEDSHSGVSQIWTIDLSGGVAEPVSPSTHNQVITAIDADRIVWTEARFGNFDIFIFTIEAAPSCGDGSCTGSETCSTCPQDCGACQPVCGDDLCNGTETCSSCPLDCGACPNEPPIANAGPDQSVHQGNLVTLDGSTSTDPDGNYPLSYAWTITSKPVGSIATLDNSAIVNPSFTADKQGDYIISLVVIDSLGLSSLPDEVLVSTRNTPPVAEAGPDQSIIVVGTTVQLDGTKSYDLYGDSFTYLWTITSKPSGSVATLSNRAFSKPTFVADVYGEYVISLVVTDIAGTASEPDTVTISFYNVKPVADAGVNQAVSVGSIVTLDGSGSSDANHDPLTYQWDFVSMPAGSAAMLSTPTSVQSTFAADKPGNYIISLVVNDGLENSDPSTVTVTATVTKNSVIDILKGVIKKINSLDPGVFKNPNMLNALTNKINAAIQMVDQGLYREALDKLENDILPKTDGCAVTGAPDANDWIKNCTAQHEVYPLITDAIALLKNMI